MKYVSNVVAIECGLFAYPVSRGREIVSCGLLVPQFLGRCADVRRHAIWGDHSRDDGSHEGWNTFSVGTCSASSSHVLDVQAV